MLSLKINNLPAILKKGTSIKLTRENPFFTGSGTYSLDVSLPLDGCRENQRIFGAIHRPENPKMGASPRTFKFHLLSPPLDLHGRAVVTQVYNGEVKVQLLSDNSETKYNLIDEQGGEVYIDSLDLGRAWEEVPEVAAAYAEYDRFPPSYNTFDTLNYDVLSALNKLPDGGHEKIHGSYSQTSSVAFPILSVEDGKRANSHDLRPPKFGFKADIGKNVEEGHIAAQPYLCDMVERILKALGYNVKRNDLKESWFKDIFIANAKNCVELSKTLPHWTANEFFEELRNFTGHWLDFNGRHVEICAPKSSLIQSASPVFIREVVDEYDYDVNEDENAKNILAANIDYKWSPANHWLRLPDEVWSGAEIVHVPNFDNNYSNVQEAISEEQKRLSRWIFHAEDTGKVVGFIPLGTNHSQLVEFDQLPPLIRHGEQYGANGRKIDMTLRIVPVQMCYTDVDYRASKNEKTSFPLPTLYTQQTRYMHMKPIFNVYETIMGYAKDEKKEEREVMEVALNTSDTFTPWGTVAGEYHLPMAFGTGWMKYPNETVTPEMTNVYYNKLNLDRGTFTEQFKLTNRQSPSIGADALGISSQINMKSEVCFSFLDRQKISPLDTFVIKGRKYACSKLELIITEEGVQPLKRGYFYEII